MKTMRKMFIIFPIISGLMFYSGCTTLRRYSSLQTPGIDSTLADIDLFGIRISQTQPAGKAKSLWDLSADAQSQFIKILNTRFPDNDRFLSSLSFEYMKGDEDAPSRDYVSKDLRLIFSVSKKSAILKDKVFNTPALSRADRLESIKISLMLRDPTLRFTGWNIYSTEYGSIDIGDVSFSRSLEVKGTAALSSKKEIGGEASIGGTASFSRREDQSVKQRYLKLNGRINKQKIEMEEEGTREIDLAGNIIADVSLEFDRTTEMLTMFRGLKDSTGAFNSADKISSEVYLVSVPKKKKIDEFIEADLKMDFVYRNVRRGRRTFPEWDDRVKYYRGAAIKTIPLFTAHDYVPGFYSIGSGSGDEARDLICIERGGDNQYPLIFSSYEEASAFYLWLMHCLTTDKDKVIKIGDQSLKFKNIDLTYEHIKEDFRFSVLPYYW
jgi:hypothetical protein